MITVLRFLLLIPTGFVLACFAAAFALLWPFLDWPPGASEDPFLIVQLVLGFMAQAAQVGSTALVPWGLFMVASESLGWRSLLLHMGAGLVAGFAAMRLLPGGPVSEASLQTAFAVAGLAFALVYWLVAGRGAGRWCRSRRKAAPAPPPPPASLA